MKLRIKGDSVRLRLARTEVRNLLEAGVVEEATRFPGGAQLRCVLSTGRGASGVAAAFDGGTLTVSLPQDVARRWGTSEDVEIRATLPLDGGALELLIEKDFPCLTVRPGEDDSDAFPRDRLLPDP
ncbi:MAG TPA: hypothetical protein VN790_00710 [Steroidobacteraceae bacterium]|nr:hypothetical protein [Steroidobacteraceae bacterium]